MFTLPSKGEEVIHIPANEVTPELLERELQRMFEEEEEYPVRPVLGVADLASGSLIGKVSVPTTIYNVSGDDTSGIAGLLKPDGEFIATAAPRRTAAFWEFDETLRYEKVEPQPPANARFARRARGNSWTSGEVLWDGSVAGSVDSLGEDGDQQGPVNKRTFDASIMGDWPENNGELWRAIGRGTTQGGRRVGRIHAHGTSDDGAGVRYGL